MATPAGRGCDAENDGIRKQQSISPHKSSPRRVLGELTPNSRVNLQRSKGGAKDHTTTTPFTSPLKYQTTVTPAELHSRVDRYAQSPLASSRKRTIEQVDASEEHDTSSTPRLRNADLNASGVFLFPAGLVRPPTITIQPLDPEESSTDDESSEDAGEDDVDTVLSSQEPAASFSSLVDYDLTDASENSDRATLAPPASETRNPVTSHVELLRLRLQMAMYKVNTNQTFIPFSNLQLPHQRKHVVPSAQVIQSPFRSQDAAFSGDSRTEQCRAVVVDVTSTGGPVGQLLPGPVLLPTATSSRTIDSQSGPPPPSRVAQSEQVSAVQTPLASRRASKLLESVDKEDRDLTSSVVKQRAAGGLLELMRAR